MLILAPLVLAVPIIPVFLALWWMTSFTWAFYLCGIYVTLWGLSVIAGSFRKLLGVLPLQVEVFRQKDGRNKSTATAPISAGPAWIYVVATALITPVLAMYIGGEGWQVILAFFVLACIAWLVLHFATDVRIGLAPETEHVSWKNSWKLSSVAFLLVASLAASSVVPSFVPTLSLEAVSWFSGDRNSDTPRTVRNVGEGLGAAASGVFNRQVGPQGQPQQQPVIDRGQVTAPPLQSGGAAQTQVSGPTSLVPQNVERPAATAAPQAQPVKREGPPYSCVIPYKDGVEEQKWCEG